MEEQYKERSREEVLEDLLAQASQRIADLDRRVEMLENTFDELNDRVSRLEEREIEERMSNKTVV